MEITGNKYFTKHLYSQLFVALFRSKGIVFQLIGVEIEYHFAEVSNALSVS